MTVLPNIVLAYTWPNPQLDELESQRYDRHGYNSRALSAGVSPCKNFLFGDTAGRANAADWIRTVRYLSRTCAHSESCDLSFSGVPRHGYS